MEEVVEVPARNGVWVELLGCVVLAEELHAYDSEDIDDNNEDEGEVPEGPD